MKYSIEIHIYAGFYVHLPRKFDLLAESFEKASRETLYEVALLARFTRPRSVQFHCSLSQADQS